MPHHQPPEPWRSFLLDLDNSLDQSVSLHCIGGFALAMLHDLPRPTIDVDCLAVIPPGETARLQQLAGQGSALHNKYGVYLQHVGVVTVPEDYAAGSPLSSLRHFADSNSWGSKRMISRCQSWSEIRPATVKTSGSSPVPPRSTLPSLKTATGWNFGHTSLIRNGTT